MFPSAYFTPTFWAPSFWPRPGGIAIPPADLLEAIIAHCDADATIAAALPGGVFTDVAPLGAALPLAVVTDLGETDDWQSPTADGTVPYDDMGTIQISVFAPAKDTARAGMRVIEASLNDAPLTFTAGTLLYLRRRGRPHTTRDPDLGPDGEDVWMQTLMFESVVSRTL